MMVVVAGADVGGVVALAVVFTGVVEVCTVVVEEPSGVAVVSLLLLRLPHAIGLTMRPMINAARGSCCGDQRLPCDFPVSHAGQSSQSTRSSSSAVVTDTRPRNGET